MQLYRFSAENLSYEDNFLTMCLYPLDLETFGENLKLRDTKRLKPEKLKKILIFFKK